MPKKEKHCTNKKWKHFTSYELASDERERENYMFVSRCTPMRDTELKEKEELQQLEKAIKKREEELRIRKEQLERCKKS
jgi:hypothetical protein